MLRKDASTSEASFCHNSKKMVGNYYSQIYDLLISTIYGDMALTSDMTLSVSLISTCLSLLVTLAPVLITGGIFVWILKRI